MPNVKKETEKYIKKSLTNSYKYYEAYQKLTPLHLVMNIVLHKMENPEYNEYLWFDRMYAWEAIDPNIKFEDITKNNKNTLQITYNKTAFKITESVNMEEEREISFPLSFFMNQDSFLESSKIIYKTTEKSLVLIENLLAMANEEIKPSEENINLFIYLHQNNKMVFSLLVSFLPLQNIAHILEIKHKKYAVEDFLCDQFELEKALVSKTSFGKEKRTLNIVTVAKFISQVKEKQEMMLLINKPNEIIEEEPKGYKKYKL